MTEDTCCIDGCERPIKIVVRGLCHPHYLRLLRREGPQRPTPEQRFWAGTEKTPTCWIWRGKSFTPAGYGVFKIAQRFVYVHRYSHQLNIGPIPEKHVIDHICHNPACVRPEHLRAVTNKQNLEHRIGPNAGSTSGVLGVSWSTGRKRWIARVVHHQRAYHCGQYATIAEAERAVVAKRLELFTHNDMDRTA